MKKASVVLLSAALAFGLSACGSEDTAVESTSTPEATPTRSAAPTGPVEVELGEMVTLTQDVNGPREVNLTFEDISVSNQCHHGRNNHTETMEDGGVYIQLTGEMEAVSGGNYSLSEVWMTGTTDDGYAVQFSPAFSCEDPADMMDGYQDFGDPVIAGQKARAVMEFWAADLPATITLTEPYEPNDYVWSVPAPTTSESSQPDQTPVENAVAPTIPATPTPPATPAAPVSPVAPATSAPDQVIGFTGAPGVDSPRVLDKTIERCGDVALHQTGTTFFTDGTTGWTETCSQQMLNQ